MYKGVALLNGGCLMLSIEVTIEMAVLMKKMTVPFFGTVKNLVYSSMISFPDPTLGWHPNE